MRVPLVRWLAVTPKFGHPHSVAKPIEPTPVLKGEDAERLLRDLEKVCSPEEAERRIGKAEAFLEAHLKKPGWRKLIDA